MREVKKISIEKHMQVASEIKKIAEAYSKITEILNFEDIREKDFDKFKKLEIAVHDVKMCMDNIVFKENPNEDISHIYTPVCILSWSGNFDEDGLPIQCQNA